MSRAPRFADVLEGFGSPGPISSGVWKEGLTTFGVSWHVPHVPVSDGMPPATRPPSATSSLIPATPVILIGRELKSASPRATAALGSRVGRLDHPSNVLKIAGVNCPYPGVVRPPGCS